MNSPGDDTYWNDGSYLLTSSIAAGERVSYASDDHSGVVYFPSGASTLLRSKWGNLPVMQHVGTYGPYNSSTLRYYRR